MLENNQNIDLRFIATFVMLRSQFLIACHLHVFLYFIVLLSLEHEIFHLIGSIVRNFIHVDLNEIHMDHTQDCLSYSFSKKCKS